MMNIMKQYLLTLLLLSTLLLSSPIYAIASTNGDEGGGEGTEESEPEPESETTDEPETEPETEPEAEPEPIVEPVVPQVEPEVEPPVECPEGFILNDNTDTCVPVPVKEARAPAAVLPPCDGSAQDCVTPNGDVCTAEGPGSHECECAEDMSDCPNHPSLQEEQQQPTTAEEEPIDPCLLDPTDDSCPEPVDGQCPTGYNMNEDGNCYPEHPNGCPAGYHSHEDDESGKCIPDSTPCEDGYIMNPGFPSCEKKDKVCEEHPDLDECQTEPVPNPPSDNDTDTNGNDTDVDVDIIIKNINNHETINKVVKHDRNTFPDVDIIGLSTKDNGDSMICLINIDDEHVQCQDYNMPNSKVEKDFSKIIELDTNKEYDDGNTGSSDIDDVIGSINDQDFSELKDADNHEFDVDLAAIGINDNSGNGMVCLVEDESDKGKALCESFRVSETALSGEITEIVEFS